MNAPLPGNTRTLVLTGASRGIGHATVKKFGASGWRIITISRQPFSALCPWPGGEKNHVQLDLGDPVELGRGIEEIRHRLAATASCAGQQRGDLAQGQERRAARRDGHAVRPVAAGVQRQLLRAGGAGARPGRRALRAQGCVVNVTSIAGSRVHPFAGSAYATSKAALASLTREMAHDFGPRGIRVNAIAPGEIDTAILSPGTEKIVEEQIPMRRLGTPDEVADVIHFLCEKGASYVSGAEIQINGGQHV